MKKEDVKVGELYQFKMISDATWPSGTVRVDSLVLSGVSVKFEPPIAGFDKNFFAEYRELSPLEPAMKFDEEIAVAVLVQHQRIGMGDCSCGPMKLGTSYPRHQVTEIIKAHREAGK